MKFTNEAKIGMLVFAALVILGGLTWKAGKISLIHKGYVLKVLFHDIERLDKNAPVTLNGLEVGRIRDIRIIYGAATRIEITLWMDSSARVHEGAQAMVKNMGFMGEKYIGLTNGDDSKPFLTAGAVIYGEEPSSLEAILRQGEDIAVNLKEISQQVNTRLKVNSESIDSILADLRVSMHNLGSISTNVNQRLEINRDNIDGTMAHLNTASKNLEEMSADLKQNPWKLMYKPKAERHRR